MLIYLLSAYTRRRSPVAYSVDGNCFSVSKAELYNKAAAFPADFRAVSIKSKQCTVHPVDGFFVGDAFMGDWRVPELKLRRMKRKHTTHKKEMCQQNLKATSGYEFHIIRAGVA